MLLETLEEDPCALSLEQQDETCVALQGSKGVGASCSHHLGLPLAKVLDCDEDLFCVLGQCSDAETFIPPPLGVGDVCWEEAPTSCGAFDLRCSAEGTCQELVGVGSPCEPLGCELPDLYCAGAQIDGAGTCSMKVAIGGACDPLDDKVCLRDADPATHCDPATRTCVEGPAPLCDEINDPVAWR